MSIPQAIRDFLEAIGFHPVRARDQKAAVFLRVVDDVVHQEVHLRASTWNPGHLGCTVRVLFHARARDAWDRGRKPFLFEISSGELVPAAVAEVGSSGTAVWDTGAPQHFIENFKCVAIPWFDRYGSRSKLYAQTQEAAAKLPQRAYLLFALGFLALEYDVAAARKYFARYLEADPALREQLGPRIESLFS